MPSFISALRTKVQEPIFIRKVNGWAVLFWIAMIYPTIFLWSRSILYVALLSIWACVISHYTAWLTARVDVRGERIEEDVEIKVEKVAEKVVVVIAPKKVNGA